MALTCAYQATFGSCEPELLARDERDRALTALREIAGGLVCGWSEGRCAEGGIVGVMRDPEAGWLPACGAHFSDDDEVGIRLRGTAS